MKSSQFTQDESYSVFHTQTHLGILGMAYLPDFIPFTGNIFSDETVMP